MTILEVPVVQWRRLSPRMLLVHPVIEVGKALPAIAGAFLAGHSSGNDSSGSRWSLGIAALVIVISLLRWFTTRYYIGPQQIQLRHGLLRRRTMTAALDRVRTVDVTSHLLHRALGLARVVIGTGTSDRKGRDRLVLDGLSASAAAALRSELLHRGPVPTPTVDVTKPGNAAEDELARIDPSWLRYAPFTLTGAVTGLALLGVVWRVVSEGHVRVRNIAAVRVVTDRVEQWPVALAIVVGVLAVVLFVAVASTLGYVLSFWRFRLTRHSGGTLHVTRGLITTRATSIEHRRLRGVELSEPMLLRSVGGARCLAIATGLRVGRGSERGGEILLPPAPRGAAVHVAAAVLETREPVEVELLQHPIAALRRRIVRATSGAVVIAAVIAVVVAVADVPLWLMAFAFVPLVLAIPLGADRYASLGHALCAGFVVTSFGSVVRRRCVLDTGGVIGWNIRASFFQRRMGLASLTATTAAGRQRYSIADVSPAEAVRFAETSVPGLLTEFLV